jgi:tetratricopeptide (TPR) repeat protein
LPNSTIPCFINIVTPERIADFVLKLDSNGQTILENYYEQEYSVIPTVASNCFGDYELYYSKENPQIGIDILKNGLEHAKNKNIVAEDLGYIFRDENRLQEAIDAFLLSEQFGPSTEYTFYELQQLFEALGQPDKQAEYLQKYKEHGGI